MVPEEIEIKLRLPPRARAALERHPALSPPRASGPETRAEVTTYFDTASGRLGRAGASLRVRRAAGAEPTQTLKLGPIVDGAAVRRGEWEWSVPGGTPDLSLLAGVKAPAADGAEVIAGLDGSLASFCTTEITRTSWRIAAEDGTIIEAVVDQGRIRAGRRAVAVSELELELKSGTPGALYRLAIELAEAAGLGLEPASKSERGMRLVGRAGRSAVAAGSVGLRMDLRGAEAFRRILIEAVGHLRLNLEPASRGDVEGVHQVRVAIRRLRAAIMLFKPLLDPQAAGRFNDALRRSGRIFGAARDWDVFASETLAAAAADGVEAAWVGLLANAAVVARAAAHLEAARELVAPGFARLLLELSAWAEDGARDPSGFGDPAMDQPLKKIMPALLDRLRHRAAKRARGIRDATGPELHALRKATKSLRYGVDFTAGAYRPKALKAVLRRCKDLQALLGTVNDAAATPDLAGRLATDERTDLGPALDALAAWAEQRGAKARLAVPKTWHALRDVDPFWR